MAMYTCGCHNNIIGMVYRFEFNTQHHYMTYVCVYVLQISCDHCEKWMHQICSNIKPGAALSTLQFLCLECTGSNDFVM